MKSLQGYIANNDVNLLWAVVQKPYPFLPYVARRHYLHVQGFVFEHLPLTAKHNKSIRGGLNNTATMADGSAREGPHLKRMTFLCNGASNVLAFHFNGLNI